MANDNNNINELVANDDDPTAELEIPSFAAGAGGAELDAKTFDSHDSDACESASGITVSELRSDLKSRKKTISRLQFDIEQLHTKWLGLEAEINAREAQTEQLNIELSASRDAVAQKEKLVRKRDRKINALKAEIRERDDGQRQLKNRIDDLQISISAATANIKLEETDATTRNATGQPAELLALQLSRTEQYADTIRQQSQDLIAANQNATREIESLSFRLDEVTREKTQLSEELATSGENVKTLQSSLDGAQSQHDEEIRLLRFELGTAQDTVVQTEEMNNQLASDLVDVHGFKGELEQALSDTEEQSSERIDKLQKKVAKLTRTADDYEQQLTTKSEAISILLAELAKKSEQIESIGEIEGVIQDIDERMSVRSSTGDYGERPVAGERITRFLIGTVDDQVLRFPLFKDRLTIGRTKDNDIQLKAEYISRRHAVIQTDGDATRIIDWGSKNGIHVNTAKVSEHFLCHGDVVTIGNARFRYEERKKRDS